MHRTPSTAPPSLRIANARFGDVVLQASQGTAISHEGLQIEGFHGYPPDEVLMAGLFIAAGRGAPHGARLNSVRSIDVAPTVLSLLGLEVPSWMEGRPIAELSASLPSFPGVAAGPLGLQESGRHPEGSRTEIGPGAVTEAESRTGREPSSR